MSSFVRLCSGFAVALVLPCAAFAQPPGQVKKEMREPNQVVETGDRDDTVVEIAGQRVAIDPQTGRIRQPTPEEAAALSAALEQQFGKRSEGITFTYLANGAVAAELDESFMEAMTVRRQADGTLQFGHTTGLNRASQAVQTEAKAKRAAARSRPAPPKGRPKPPILEDKE